MRTNRRLVRLFVRNAVVIFASQIAVLAVTARFAPPNLWHALGLIATMAGIALIGGLVAALWTQRGLDRSLRQVATAAKRLADGDLSASAHVHVAGNPHAQTDAPDDDDLTGLARSVNALGRKLAVHANVIDGQRRTQESLLSQLHEGVIVADDAGRITLVNPAAVELLNLASGVQADERGLIGRAVERCVPLHDLQLMLRRERGAGERGGARLSEARVTIETGQQTVHLLARASDIALSAHDGAPAAPRGGRLLVLTDITELTHTMQVKTDFVANASHELRTPLSTIRAAVEALAHMDLAAEGAEARRFVEVIDRHSTRLAAMVSDLLDLSRLESPLARFAPALVDPRQELAELEQRFAEAARSRSLELRVDRPEDVGEALVNAQLLRLALDNLVDNAIKFTEPGGSVRVSCRRAGEAAAFEVADTGCGIAEQDQERVFERFYQVEKARSGSQRGTGLGLSIVRHAVAAMGGSVRLRSQVGQGTTVTIAVPQPD